MALISLADFRLARLGAELSLSSVLAARPATHAHRISSCRTVIVQRTAGCHQHSLSDSQRSLPLNVVEIVGTVPVLCVLVEVEVVVAKLLALEHLSASINLHGIRQLAVCLEASRFVCRASTRETEHTTAARNAVEA